MHISHMPPRVLVHEAPRPPGGEQRQATHPDGAKPHPNSRSVEVRALSEGMVMDPQEAALIATHLSMGCLVSATLSHMNKVSCPSFKIERSHQKAARRVTGGLISSILLPFPVLADRSCAE